MLRCILSAGLILGALYTTTLHNLRLVNNFSSDKRSEFGHMIGYGTEVVARNDWFAWVMDKQAHYKSL